MFCPPYCLTYSCMLLKQLHQALTFFKLSWAGLAVHDAVAICSVPDACR